MRSQIRFLPPQARIRRRTECVRAYSLLKQTYYKTTAGTLRISTSQCPLVSSSSSRMSFSSLSSPMNTMVSYPITLSTTRSYSIVSTTTTTTTTSTTSTSTSTSPTTSESETSSSSDNNNNGDVRTSKVKNEMDRLLARASAQVNEISKLIVEGVQRNNDQQKSKEKKKNLAHGFKPTTTTTTTTTAGIVDDVKEKTSSVENKISNQNDDDDDVDNSHSHHHHDGDENNMKNTMSTNHQHTSNIQSEIAAAEALLKLTSHTKFQIAFRQKQRQTYNEEGNENVLHNFHYTFLSAIDWLCQTLSDIPYDLDNDDTDDDDNNDFGHDSNDAILLLDLLINLNERSQKLNLPLTLPQYKKLCTLIARYGNDESAISLDVLDLSTVARDLLSSNPAPTTSYSEDQVIQPSFFSDVMQELLHRNRIREMIELFHGMRNVHQIDSVEFQCGIDLLSKLKDKVDESIRTGTFIKPSVPGIDDYDEPNVDPNIQHAKKKPVKLFDETDAMELAIILQEPVIKELTLKKKELEAFELNDAIDSFLDNEENYDDDDDDDDWDDETVYGLDDNDDFSDDDLNSSQLSKEQYSKDYSYDDLIEENSIELQKEIQNLNELVKSMELNNNDANAKQAAQNAAIAVLEKIQRRKTRPVFSNQESTGTAQEESMNNDGANAEVTTNEKIEANDIPHVESKKIAESQHNEQSISNDRRSDLDDFIYTRDQTWELPDLVPQLEEWNSNTGLSFTKEYEDELIKEISGEDDDDHPTH